MTMKKSKQPNAQPKYSGGYGINANQSMEDISESEDTSNAFVFKRRDVREAVRDDVVKIYELIAGPVQVKLFNTKGQFMPNQV